VVGGDIGIRHLARAEAVEEVQRPPARPRRRDLRMGEQQRVPPACARAGRADADEVGRPGLAARLRTFKR
jgi:hypothetical protein